MQNKQKGFTLIELMVTIAVLAIIAMMAAPSFGDMLQRQNLNKSVQDLAGVITEARAQSVLTRSDVTVNFALDSSNLNGTDEANVKNKKLYIWAASGQSKLKTATSPLVFEMTGRVKDATSDVSIEVCNQKGDKSKIFSISKMGTIQQTTEGTCT